jgi:hypothetical protein
VTDDFGDICAECDRRYCLPPERATCAHVNVCEDCWPNGCDTCAAALPRVPWVLR